MRHANRVVALRYLRELEQAAFPHVREAPLEFRTVLAEVALGGVSHNQGERLVEFGEVFDADVSDAYVGDTRSEKVFHQLFLFLGVAAIEAVTHHAGELALQRNGVAEFAGTVVSDKQAVFNANLMFLIVFENRRGDHMAAVVVNHERDLAFHIERNGAIVAGFVGGVDPAFGDLTLRRNVENHVVELLNRREAGKAFFGQVDGGEVALDANRFKHFLEQKRHVLAVALVLFQRDLGGLRNQAVSAESHVAVADIVAHKVHNSFHGVVVGLAAADFAGFFTHAHGLLELVLDQILVIFTDVFPFLFAGEHQTCAKVAVHGHVKFFADDDRVFDLPFDAALDRLLFQRAVFFGHKTGGVGVNAETGFTHGNILTAHEVGVGDHALVFDIRAAELQVNEIARFKLLQREMRCLRFVLAADFGGVGNVGSVQVRLLLQVPVAVVDFEGVQVNTVESGQEIEGEFAVDGSAANVENFHEHFVGADPVCALFGFQSLLVVMHHSREIAFGALLLGAFAKESLQVLGAFFHRRNRLLQRAVVGLAEECLRSGEETLGVFVIGL